MHRGCRNLGIRVIPVDFATAPHTNTFYDESLAGQGCLYAPYPPALGRDVCTGDVCTGIVYTRLFQSRFPHTSRHAPPRVVAAARRRVVLCASALATVAHNQATAPPPPRAPLAAPRRHRHRTTAAPGPAAAVPPCRYKRRQPHRHRRACPCRPAAVATAVVRHSGRRAVCGADAFTPGPTVEAGAGDGEQHRVAPGGGQQQAYGMIYCNVGSAVQASLA